MAIYLDHNATTRPDPRVVEAMLPFLTEQFHNASSPYPQAEAVADAVRRARGAVARLVGAAPGEVVFTSGGSESVATAFHGAAAACEGGARRRVILSTVEHSATKGAAAALEARGFELLRVPVDAEGRLDRDALLFAIDGATALVSLMVANNETGVRTDLEGVAEACARAGALLHLDAVQAPGKLPLDDVVAGAHYVSLAAHKFHGPKGVGALVVRGGAPFTPLVHGGPQEGERRAGTENTPGLVGMGVAAELAREAAADAEGLRRLGERRDRLERGLLDAIEDSRVNGGGAPRVVNTTNLLVPGVEAVMLLALLADEGVLASAGSACNAQRVAPSPVLLAMGRSEAEASQSLRLSLGRGTTDEEVERAIEVVARCAGLCRGL